MTITEYTPPWELAGDPHVDLDPGLICSISSATAKVSVSTIGSIAVNSVAGSSVVIPESTEGFVIITVLEIPVDNF